MIKNRNDVELAVNVLKAKNQKGLAFVVHGLGGSKEQIHIEAMIQTFNDADYTVVSHDAANSIGESGGKMEDATLTNYYEDFQDVVKWAKKQDFYEAPFIISGHSLGGACSILYASQHPDEVKGIVPVSAFIGGVHWKKVREPEYFEDWKKRGYILEKSNSKPGVTKKIKWELFEDTMNYDLTKDASKVTCPVLLLVGSEDRGTPESAQRLIETAVKGSAEVKVIDGMRHNPRTKEHLSQLKSHLLRWLQNLE